METYITYVRVDTYVGYVCRELEIEIDVLIHNRWT